MRSVVIAAVLVSSSSLTISFAKAQAVPSRLVIAGQAAVGSGEAGSPDNADATVVLESRSNRHGTYNVQNGTQGPFWSAQGIWNSSTKRYVGLVIAAGSNRLSGFSDTRALFPGMTVEMTSGVIPPNTTIVSVAPSSVVLSNPSTRDGIGEAATFALANDGVMFNQVITNYPSTFPRRTKIEWSYPSERNNASVYSYAIIGGYGVGSGGYFRPVNKPAPKKVSEFTDLSITYDVSVSGGPNDFDFLIETFPTTASDPSSPQVANTVTNEIGFLPHVPDFLWTYILTLSDHFDYSSPDGTFHAYVATRPGKAFTDGPPFTMIVPVTEAQGRTPRDMMDGKQTLPLLGVLRELVARGIMPADTYVCGFDFGFEIGRNAGRAILNDIAWKWQ